MTPSEWETIAAAFESAAVGTAAIVGGIWALFQFHVLKRVQKALSELEAERQSNRLAAAQASLAEEQLIRRATLTFTLKHASVQPPADVARALLCTVRARNFGNRSTALDLSMTTLTGTAITSLDGYPFAPPGAAVSAFAAQGEGLGMLSPKEELDFSFLLFIPAPGLYLLHFQTTCSPELVQDASEHLATFGIAFDEAAKFVQSVYSLAAVV